MNQVPPEILALIDPHKQYPAGFPAVDPHPVIDVPDPDDMAAWGEEISRKLLWERYWTIQRMAEDPLRYGHINSDWQIAEAQFEEGCKVLLVMGGNRSGKSQYAARKVVDTLAHTAGKRAWCFQTTGPNSIEMQQPYIYNYLPPEWRNVKKGKITDVTYRRKTGFSENTFILPNESQCWFRNYAQDISTIEGGEIDIAWCDELVPLDWLETIRYRLVTRNGLLILTFTPIEGYSPTVREFLQGAKTIRTAPAELLPLDPANPAAGCERVPVVQRCQAAGRRVVYFHTQNNPFSGYDRIRQELAGARREDILCRAYGVPTRATANKFPRFNPDVHIIPAEKVPKTGTWYQVCDPCSGRNFFMIWALVTPDEKIIIAREWPQANKYIEGVGFPGAWAEPDGKLADGRRGPAQKPFGFGLQRYVEEIDRVERSIATDFLPRKQDNGAVPEREAIEPLERIMDSRYGNAPTLAKTESTTLIEELSALGVHFIPAPGENQQEGIDMINSALDYDTTRPIDALNQPRLYVCADCENTIFSLKEWTDSDGKHSASKDPVDVLRYLLLSKPMHITADSMRAIPGGSY